MPLSIVDLAESRGETVGSSSPVYQTTVSVGVASRNAVAVAAVAGGVRSTRFGGVFGPAAKKALAETMEDEAASVVLAWVASWLTMAERRLVTVSATVAP